MSSSKNDYNKAYDEGYNAGKNGGFMDDFVNSNKDIIPFPDSGTTKSYDAGYRDGASDRYDDHDSNYNGGTSDSGGCFITSAVLSSVGKSDNCEELTILRNYRDEWLKNQVDGPALISDYYEIAPIIVQAINSQHGSKDFYLKLWFDEIRPCVDLIKKNQLLEAKTSYVKMVLDLKQKFLPFNN